jgi:hypothetical protein
MPPLLFYGGNLPTIIAIVHELSIIIGQIDRGAHPT